MMLIPGSLFCASCLHPAPDAGLPRSNPRQHRPHQDQRDLRPPRLWCDAAEERPRADQPAVRPCDWEEKGGEHQAQNPLHVHLHQGDQRAGKAASISAHSCSNSCKGCSPLNVFGLLLIFQGTITLLGGEEGIINSEAHGELPFDTCENFSDTEFSSSDVQKEVEFTVATVSLMTWRPRDRKPKASLS